MAESDEPKRPPVSRTRTRSEDVAPNVADRVAHIADLMARGQYRTRLTSRKLAKAWGLSESTTANMASEASRLLRFPAEERDGRRLELAAWFEAAAAKALARKNIITGLPDVAAALKAKELYARYAGLEPVEGSDKPAAPSRIVISLEESKCTEEPKDPASSG